ncbi:MAG TPA: hypothetical protein VF057_11240 [Thermoanaerobaculia bacterium]
MVLALSAAAIRLIPLQWLHPLNWDELEFFVATKWIAGGRVPFRDFWEHHTPLAWYLFAPFAWITDDAGVGGVIFLRWVQLPVWIAAFALIHRWMRAAQIERFDRWSAMALPLCSSLFMLPAIEYRVDSLAAMLYLGGLVAAWRGGARFAFLAGVSFCLAAFANLRLGPLLVVTVLVLAFADPSAKRWRFRRDVFAIAAGGVATLVVALALLGFAGALRPAADQLFFHNRGNEFANPLTGAFLHRVITVFGIRLIRTDQFFSAAAVDPAGIAIVILGVAGMLRALTKWKAPDSFFVLALLQIANVLFVASMKAIYNYHLLLIVLMMLPFVASEIGRIPKRSLVVAIVAVGWTVNLFASVFRGKELDRAYQDLVMREVQLRTSPTDRIWGGMHWAADRQPSYRLWFLPDLARTLVTNGIAAPYALRDVIADPPAVVVFDHYALIWVTAVQPQLGPYFSRHYIPVWRNLWVPGMNATIERGKMFEWIAPRSAEYRVHASESLAAHPWFRSPLQLTAYKGPRVAELTFRLPEASTPTDARWLIDGQEVPPADRLNLQRGQRLRVINGGATRAFIVMPGNETLLLRQPPPGVSLEADATRMTHVPRIGAEIAR